MNEPFYPAHVGIVVQSAEQLSAVYALLGGASLAVMAVPAKPQTVLAAQEKPVVEPEKLADEQPAPEEEVQHDPNDIDAHGHPWSAALHASTRSKTKEGLWRMKVGVTRPEPLAGFPKADGTIGTQGNDAGSSAGAPATGPAAGPVTTEEDDEFAAFRAAAEKSNTTDTAAAAAVPARKWTDADLGSLCNQAAMKLGDPTPIKEIIATFVPAGQVAHSRMIPDEKREEFAQAVEAKVGITFAG